MKLKHLILMVNVKLNILDRIDRMDSSMTDKEMWNRFINEYNLRNTEYEAWSFGVDPDHLLSLVLSGKKTGTSSAYPLYELENEPLPKIGEYSVILDSKDNAKCIVQTTNVEIIPFKDITAIHALKEGEGDLSLEYWKDVHYSFFTKCMEENGLKFSSDMMVVFEEFKVVYK